MVKALRECGIQKQEFYPHKRRLYTPPPSHLPSPIPHSSHRSRETKGVKSSKCASKTFMIILILVSNLTSKVLISISHLSSERTSLSLAQKTHVQKTFMRVRVSYIPPTHPKSPCHAIRKRKGNAMNATPDLQKTLQKAIYTQTPTQIRPPSTISLPINSNSPLSAVRLLSNTHLPSPASSCSLTYVTLSAALPLRLCPLFHPLPPPPFGVIGLELLIGLSPILCLRV